MKRRRTSCRGRNEVEGVSQPKLQNSVCSLAKIPQHILVSVLLRLPIKEIFVCKCVCKTLHDIVLDPEFAKLHSRQAEVYPMVRTFDPTRLSRTLYLVQLEHSEGFDLMLDVGYYSKGGGRRKSSYPQLFDMKLDTKFKLPLRNFELVVNGNEGLSSVHNPQSSSKRSRSIKLKPKDHKCKIVNSCNGLLCLSEPFSNNPVVICNPVTGEFINLPEAGAVTYPYAVKDYIDCGLGYSQMTNKYKVIRIFSKRIRDDDAVALWFCGREAEVLTVGMRLWKHIGSAPSSMFKLAFPTNLNGSLHWFCVDDKSSHAILSFDIDKEQFQSMPAPSNRGNYFQTGRRHNISLGVLDGFLCICNAFWSSIDVWVMKDYGIEESWTKVFSMPTDCYYSRWTNGLYLPIKYMNDGELLIFHYQKSALICYDPRKYGFKYLKVQGVKSKFEAIAHTPSFISLKDVFGDQVEVLNIHSRCSELKLQGESRTISLVEEDRQMEIDTSDSDGGRERWDKHFWRRF